MEALKYLMGAYFHQDWDMDGGNSADTVASFLNERPALVSACADEIDLLLARELAEGELVAQLAAWGCGFRAGETDEDYRVWLAGIRTQIRTFLSTAGTNPPGSPPA